MTSHILFLSRSTPLHGIGGMEVVGWDLACAFAKRGLEVTFLTTTIPGKPREFIDSGVKVVTIPKTNNKYYSRHWWTGTKEYVEKHLVGKVTGVISVSAGGFSILPLRKLMPNTKFIMQAHGTSIGEVVSKWRSKKPGAIIKSIKNMIWIPKDIWAYRWFDTIVAVGDAVYSSLTSFPMSIFVNQQKIECIHNGIDTSKFSPCFEKRIEMRNKFGFTDDTTVILTSCRLHLQKGVNYAIQGFAKYLKVNPDSFFVIIGDGPEKENLQALSRKLGVANKILFVGSVSRNKIPDYLQLGDLFLFTTLRNEGLPLNILEAIAVGLPVMASGHLNFKSDEIENYYKVNPTNINEIAEMIQTALENNDTLNKLPFVYSLEYVADRYLSLILNKTL